MAKFHRTTFLLALTTLVVFADARTTSAQRRGLNFGGGSNNNSNNNDPGGGRRNRDRDDDHNNSDIQQSQQFFQGGQGGQQQFQNSQQLRRFQKQNGPGNWPLQNHFNQRHMQNWVVGFNGGPIPFSNDWYDNHPQAWHHRHHHDAWEIATAAGVLAWLGWQATYPPSSTTIIYEPVPVETAIVEGQPAVVVDPAAGEWMTLGVYSLMTGPGDSGTQLLQLSVDKQGQIRGSYYDMIANATYNVVGLIDQPTQQARWTLDTNRQLTFVATLDQLTQSQGTVHVKLPSGQLQQWQLVRMENASN